MEPSKTMKAIPCFIIANIFIKPYSRYSPPAPPRIIKNIPVQFEHGFFSGVPHAALLIQLIVFARR